MKNNLSAWILKSKLTNSKGITQLVSSIEYEQKPDFTCKRQ